MSNNFFYKSLWCFYIIMLSFLVACANTPNNITFSFNQGQCVQESQYASPTKPTLNNPSLAPYCMAVTIQNNNNGTNANNIQIISTGLTLSYKVLESQFSGILFDPIAASIPIPSGSTQTVGNIKLYDPYNCATTQGANITNIGYNGGKCTFYLQLVNESFPVGVYPLNLTYNYTNGNQNYTLNATINQRVNLFAGSNSGFYLFNNTQESWQNVTINNTNPSINALAKDNFGNIYIASNNTVYLNNLLITKQLGSTLNNVSISGITTSNINNIYLSTSNGIYYFNNDWSLYQSTLSKQYIGINANSSNYVIAITANNGYSCNSNMASTCTWNSLNSTSMPSIFNSLNVDANNILFTGSTNQLFNYSNSTWNLASVSLQNTITAINNIVAANSNEFIYFGTKQVASTSENALFACSMVNSSSPNCVPLLSSQGNFILGNVLALVIDPYNNVYMGGGNLNSPDFNNQNLFSGAYINTKGTSAVGLFKAITGSINSGINSLVIASALTTN